MRTEFFQFKILHNQTPQWWKKCFPHLHTKRQRSFWVADTQRASVRQVRRQVKSKNRNTKLTRPGARTGSPWRHRIMNWAQKTKDTTAVSPPGFSVLSCLTQNRPPTSPTRTQSARPLVEKLVHTHQPETQPNTIRTRSCSTGLRHGLWGQVYEACFQG